MTPSGLADAGPLQDEFTAGVTSGLIGQSGVTSSDLAGTVTFYVFSDSASAQAFFDSPPLDHRIGEGCGACTSMGNGVAITGLGQVATSYVLYEQLPGSNATTAIATYILNGDVVIEGLSIFTGNFAAPPSDADRASVTAYARAGLHLLTTMRT